MKDYMKKSISTDLRDYQPAVDRIDQHKMRLLHAAIGIATESGELLDALKKHLYYGKELDYTNLEEEAGDLFWYMALLLDELKLDPNEVMAKNIAKLNARYPEKFTKEAALNRDLEKERKILERDK